MKSSFNNKILNIELEGKIDTSNSSDIEKEIFELVDSLKPQSVLLDAAALEYISSAGLRVILRLKKTIEDTRVINVSSAVYEIFDVTGFTAILNVQKAIREISVEGCEIIGKGGQGTVYRLDRDTIVKLYYPGFNLNQIDNEMNTSKKAFLMGIPTAISYDVVKCDDRYGIVYELIHSDTLSNCYKKQPENFNEFTDKYVQFVKDFHKLEIPEGNFVSLQTILHERANKLIKHCSKEEIQLLHSLVDEIPYTCNPLHCDLHPGNIMIQNGELLLIDMPAICTGPSYWELTGIYRDLVSAPVSSPQVIEQSVGLDAETVKRIGQAFFMKYSGISDPAEFKAYMGKLGLLYAFNVVLVIALGQEVSNPYVDVVLNKLLRETVIPNEQTLRYLLKNM